MMDDTPFFLSSHYCLFYCRVYEWIFSHCHSEEVVDPIKTVFIGGLHELLSSDSAKSQSQLMQVSLSVFSCSFT